MKKIALTALIVALLASVAAASGFKVATCMFGSSTSTSIVQAGKDTSDAIEPLSRGAFRNAKFPTAVALQWKTVEVNDSTYIYLDLQVSADNSNWSTWAHLDTTTTADDIPVYTFSSIPSYPYWRVIVTGAMAAGDTVTVGPVSFSFVY